MFQAGGTTYAVIVRFIGCIKYTLLLCIQDLRLLYTLLVQTFKSSLGLWFFDKIDVTCSKRSFLSVRTTSGKHQRLTSLLMLLVLLKLQFLNHVTQSKKYLNVTLTQPHTHTHKILHLSDNFITPFLGQPYNPFYIILADKFDNFISELIDIKQCTPFSQSASLK